MEPQYSEKEVALVKTETKMDTNADTKPKPQPETLMVESKTDEKAETTIEERTATTTIEEKIAETETYPVVAAYGTPAAEAKTVEASIRTEESVAAPAPALPAETVARAEASSSTKVKILSLSQFPAPPPPPQDPLPRPSPLRANPTNGGRPMTASTRRLSFASLSSSKRPIKYGRGKHSAVELVPQPSDDIDDPLNWPTWKKDLNFGALLMTVALASVMKTALVTVNIQLEQSFNVSYTSIAALTGAPLIVGALSGILALTAARLWGKRPVYLAATLALLVGSAWNVYLQDFTQCMAARMFQGVGWGVFDSLVFGSIHDTYFEHERGLRIAIHQIVAVATTWGGPLLGGLASQHDGMGYRLQFQILASFQAVSVLLMVFAAPETSFDRSFVSYVNTPATAASWASGNKGLPLRPRGSSFSIEGVKDYLRGMRPHSYTGPGISSAILLQAPRAAVAPTTLLLFLVSFLPFSILWALAGSLSLMFAHLPFELSPSSIGALMAGPFLMGAGTAAFFSLLAFWRRRFFPHINMAAVAGGSVLVFISLLTTGLYAEMCMTPPPDAAPADASAASAAASASESSIYMVGGVSARLSFPALGFLLGLLASGAYALDATVRPTVGRSTQFTSSNLGVALRNTVDMDAGVSAWRAAAAGAFVIGTPNLAWSWGLMRATLLGTAVAQLAVAGVLGAVWWLYDEHIRRLDGRVMKCVDLKGLLKRTGSFFDTD